MLLIDFDFNDQKCKFAVAKSETQRNNLGTRLVIDLRTDTLILATRFGERRGVGFVVLLSLCLRGIGYGGLYAH